MMDYKALATWALSCRTGASSLAIATRLSGIGEQSGNYPHDGGDFGRCETLLDYVPEFRARLGEMATVNKYWAALVPRWDEIKAAPADAKYGLIQSIVRGIEDADTGLIRLGKGVTMRFGKI
jgi:hypothetical protein